MKTSKFAKSIVAATLLASVAGAANATLIVGRANLSFGQVLVTLGELDWNPPVNPGLDVVPTYGGFFTNQAANTGVFAGAAFAGVTPGQVQDLSANPLDANYAPIFPAAMNQPDFLRFAAQPGWKFSATRLEPGTIGPYLLAQQGANVNASISVSGVACDTGGDAVCDAADDKTPWTGIFSAQYTNTTIANIVNILTGGGALDNNTWSATIEAFRVPEPATLGIAGLALTGIAGLARRKAKKQA